MYLGIDIGKTGAIGVLSANGHYVKVVDLPLTPILVGRGKHRKPHYRINTTIFHRHFYWLTITTCTMEAVWGQATNGCQANFSMGRYLGGIEVCLDALTWANHEPCVQYAPPATWKKHFGLLRQDKGASLELARKLFPEAPLSRKKDHNRAEALLIARYGWATRKEG